MPLCPTRLPLGCAAALVLLLCAAAPRAAAGAEPGNLPDATDEITPEALAAARRHFDMGLIFYTTDNLPAAREEFEEAYRLSHRPDLLFNLARVSERMGRREDAVLYLERYLLVLPEARDADEVRRKIASLRARGVNPPPPGVGVPVALPPRPSRLPPLPALCLLGGGAAALITGIGLGAGALAAARTVGSSRYDGQYFNADLQAIERRGQAMNAAAITLDVLGGLALAGGVAFTAVWAHGRRQGQAPPLRVLFSPGGAALSGGF